MIKELTLRDHIAIQQLQALTIIYWADSESYSSGADLIKCQCETAYEYADRMLIQRDLPQNKPKKNSTNKNKSGMQHDKKKPKPEKLPKLKNKRNRTKQTNLKKTESLL